MQKIWIFIWRLNPPHIWHIKVIKTSLKSNNKTIIFLWSKDIIDNKNPFSYEDRKLFIENIFKNKNLIIDFINDYPTDEEWIKKIWEKIKKYSINNENKITFFGWDFENDSAIIAIKNNLKYLWYENIDFFEVYRKNILLSTWEEISGTNLRQHLENWDFVWAKKLIYPRLKNLIINKWKEKFTLIKKSYNKKNI